MEELKALLERTKTAPLTEPDYEKLKAAIETLGYLTQLLEDRQTTIQRLRQILFGAATEKLHTVLKSPKDDPSSAAPAAEREREEASKPAQGHGRNGAAAYRGATKIVVQHPSFKTADRCPQCQRGKLYASIEPARLIRIVGQAPIAATVYELEKLRCNLCGDIFTAPEPPGIGPEPYDASAASMIALLKYGSGLPFNRLEGLQQSLGIPLPASTQWGIIREMASLIEPAYRALIEEAAQGEVLHNDDTPMTILSLVRKRSEREAAKEGAPGEAASERSGTFTSGIVGTREGRQIALFFTGERHAGENLAAVLKRRSAVLGPPIQMCDALTRNVPADFKVILSHCMAHARRKFVDVAVNFPEPCRYVLETLRDVYHNEALSKEQQLSAEKRLIFHQAHSAPLMQALQNWSKEQIETRQVEPNSGLGQAIAYLNKHWQALTQFLRVAGAPLDNNICERALKKAILHRKNALFYKTPNGARVGDIFMSLIYTCQLCSVNPFDYLTELQKHAKELAQSPPDWLPWNYRETLDRLAASGQGRP